MVKEEEQRQTVFPSVVTWWVKQPCNHGKKAAEQSEVNVAKGKAKRSREVEAMANLDESSKRKRDRKQTQLFDPVEAAGTPTRMSPVEPQKAPELQSNGSHEVGKRRRKVPQRLSPDLAVKVEDTPATPSAAKPKKIESSWPAAWKKLLDRVIPVPRDSLPDGASYGLKEPSFMQQMRGTRTRHYVGRPVRVLAHGNWQGAITSSLEEVNGKRRVMLSSGEEEDFETSEKAGRLRYDDRASGDFAVGRHAQVLFDGGLWFVGVVAALEVDSYGDATAAVLLFEAEFFLNRFHLYFTFPYLLRIQDGDRVRVPLADPTIELLPQEWSEHVERKKKWEWWGYNKDRVQEAMRREGAEKSLVPQGAEAKRKGRQPVAKKGAGRGGVAEHSGNGAQATRRDTDPAAAGGARGRGKRAQGLVNGNCETLENSAEAAAAAEDALSREIEALMEQMRGANTGFYVGCPVEVNVAGKAWVKGSVVSAILPKGSADTLEDTVAVRLASGEELKVPRTAESGEIRFDHEACGKIEVGRHVQLLFDGGLWYIGVIAAVRLDDAGNVTQARTLFEDGEDTWIDWPDPSEGTALMTVEWTANVSRACRWGWWGFNTDRVRHINKKLRDERKAAGEEEGADSKQLRVAIPEAGDDAEPPTPRGGGRLSARGKSVDYSKLVLGSGLGLLPGEEEAPESSRKKKQKKAPAAIKKASSTPRSGGPGSNLSPLAIALTLCDSLRDAAYQDCWGSHAARSKWKELIANPANDLADFGLHMRFFESRLCRSALVASYSASVREGLLEEFNALRDEKHARKCVQTLSSNVATLLFKSEQERKLCCGR